MVSVTGSLSLGETSAYAAKFGSGSTTTLSGVLSLVSGGMILNGATLNYTGSGALHFAQPTSTLFGLTLWNPVTGMVFAGSTTASTIACAAENVAGDGKVWPWHPGSQRQQLWNHGRHRRQFRHPQPKTTTH